MNDHVSAEDFAAYLDGMLRPEHKTELENHFSGCQACLDELLEIAGIMDSRQGKIPAEFLKLALGEKTKTAKSVLNLRLAFEIAAVFVVVVFMGYLFFDNYRFWQTPERQKPAVMLEKDLGPAATSPAVRAGKMAPPPARQRERADVREIKSEQNKADADQNFADSLVSEKKKSVVGDKGMPAAMTGSVQTRVQENKLQGIAVEKPQPATMQKNFPKKAHASTTSETEALSDVQFDFAAKDETPSKVLEMKAGGIEQNLEAQKEPGAGVALPGEAKEEKFKDEKSSLKSSLAIPVTVAAEQPASSPIRIVGDVVWSDLRNPELFFAWSWFPKDLALELRINAAGTVTAAVPFGKTNPALARQAAGEARKLLFSVSKKRSRRARLLANELPSNPR